MTYFSFISIFSNLDPPSSSSRNTGRSMAADYHTVSTIYHPAKDYEVNSFLPLFFPAAKNATKRKHDEEGVEEGPPSSHTRLDTHSNSADSRTNDEGILTSSISSPRRRRTGRKITNSEATDTRAWKRRKVQREAAEPENNSSDKHGRK